MSDTIDFSLLNIRIDNVLRKLEHNFTRPSAVYRPTLTVEPDPMWTNGKQRCCATYGCVKAYGDTPSLAMSEFDFQWQTQQAPPKVSP